MTTSANKLIDKYQYNQNDTFKDGEIEIITANHTLLKHLFTLKKMNVKMANEIGRYKSILNEIQILKKLPISNNYIKCHKMLKTSNNIYIVYDQIGQNQTLKQFIQKNPNLSEDDKLDIINKIIKCLNQFRKFKIIHAFFNVQNIQINFNHQIKFVNFQHAYQMGKTQKLSKQIFRSIIQNNFTPPEIKQSNTNQLFIDQIQNADIYCLGNILLQMTKNGKISKNKVKNVLSFQQDFYQRRQNQLIEFGLKCLNKNSEKRVSFKQIQQFLQKKIVSLKLIASRNIEQNQFNLNSSKSNVNLAISQPYSSKKSDKDSGSDAKSIKSSKSNILKSIPNIPQNNTKESSFQKNHVYQNNVFRQLVSQLIQKRNLSLYLLQMSQIFLSIKAIDEQTRIITAFLHLKKSGLVICQLAKIIQKAQFKKSITEKQKKQFTRSGDYMKLSHFIRKQMNINKKIIQQAVNLLESNISIIFKQNNSFKVECQSQSINNMYLKQMIGKYLQNLIQKVNYCHSWSIKRSRLKSPQKQLIKSRSNLKVSTKYSQRQLQSPKLQLKSKYSNALEVQSNFLQVCSTRSIGISSRSIKTSRSSQPEEYQNLIVQKIVDKQQLQYLSIACNIFKFQTYQDVFEKLIQNQSFFNRKQFIIKQYKDKQIGELLVSLRKKLRDNQ